MLYANDLRGRAVVAGADTAPAGHVDDLLFDATYRRVVGIRIKKGLMGHVDVVPRAAIVAIGPDAVTLAARERDTSEAGAPSADLSGAVSLGQVHGTKVCAASGDVVGSVADVELDDGAHFVTGYRLAPPLLARLRPHAEPLLGAGQVLHARPEEGSLIIPDALAAALRTAR